MNTNYAWWRSKTFWTIAVTFIISGTNGIQGLLPAWSLIYVQGLLSLLAAYFHVAPMKALGARN